MWQVKAERVVYDQIKHKVRFSNAVIDIHGVPVAWVPAFSIPDPTVRYATGLLTPEVGNSTKIGYFLRQPIYVAISNSQDLTLAPMVSTSGGELLEAEYRLRWNNGGMWFQGSGAYNPNGGLSGAGPQTYGHLFGSGRVGLGENARLGFDLQLTSNNAYMRFYDISFLDRLVNDLFLEATPGRSRLALTSYYFQGLRSTDVTSRIPYILPRLDISYIPTQKVGGGTFPPRPQRRCHRPGRRPQRPAWHRRDQLARAHRLRQRPALDLQCWTRGGDTYHFENSGIGTPADGRLLAAARHRLRGARLALALS